MKTRRQEALEIRKNAAQLAADRPHPRHENNGEEFLYRHLDDPCRPTYLASFTKGLPHDESGLVQFPPKSGQPIDSDPSTQDTKNDPFETFVLGIQSGDPEDFRRTPLGPPAFAYAQPPDPTPSWRSAMAQTARPADDPPIDAHCPLEGGEAAKPSAEFERRPAKVRAWESAGAGHVFDLEGPDAQALSMPPAPRLDSDELCAEMAEVYLMALLRDVPFAAFRDGGSTGIREDEQKVDDAIKVLRSLKWFDSMNRASLDPPARDRNRQMTLDRQSVFRGLSPGDDLGPYLSQFLLVGSRHLASPGKSCFGPQDGQIQYGSLRVDQRVRIAEERKDYMTTWEQWLDVQNGADLRGLETYPSCTGDEGFRFLMTPRDLATYVHYDALYEAYLNACLLMLSYGVPFDRGIPFQLADNIDKQQGFAHFGGPQILTLVTEVATRALKAVRFQKFNVHRRARPEQVAGLLHRYVTRAARDDAFHLDASLAPLEALRDCLASRPVPPIPPCTWRAPDEPAPQREWADGRAPFEGDSVLDQIRKHNDDQNRFPDRSDDPTSGEPSYLLPMAFPEGSPMHPAYGAGHATVAGACVTVLKAYFDHGFPLTSVTCGAWEADPSTKGRTLRKAGEGPLTVEGELNKLAANISIGRDWAGVHYFTDYIESIRVGEEIALGLLEEQKLTYRENFAMTVPLFSGEVVRI